MKKCKFCGFWSGYSIVHYDWIKLIHFEIQGFHKCDSCEFINGVDVLYE